MPLLDLPPEIFQRVIAIYVHIVGIRKAARIRTVCRTFTCFINEEFFARQPASKFIARVPKELLGKTIPKTKASVPNDHVDTASLVAIMLQRRDLVTALLSNGADVWGGTSPLGRPLVTAASKKDVEVLYILLSKARETDGGQSQTVQSNTLVEAMLRALQDNLAFASTVLLYWHIKHLGKPALAQRDQLFAQAAHVGHIPLLGMLLDQVFIGPLKEKYTKVLVDSLQANKHSAAILAVCLEKRLVHSDTRFRSRPNDEASALRD
ncbi:hypothetical protein EK21DRAFT_110110 [Setomelanomma holmii]|uniref:F-box domain-containing protein n=1 Tax=Setomelanomma holmii TaxID=210430 RepID=A0A9P4HFP7_9PLEO|nr:hypothetical protein EK21DRAFT_110110 [Setomelanomma holmii]